MKTYRKKKFWIQSAIGASILAGCASPGGIGASRIESISIQSGGRETKFEIAKQTPSSINITKQMIATAIIGSIKKDVGNNAELQYNQNTNNIEISYRWALALNHNILSADYTLHISDNTPNWIVSLKCPTSMTSDIVDMSITGIPKFNHTGIASRIVSSCHNLEFSIPFTEEVKSEIDTQFNDVSTFSNFRRKLKPARDAWLAYSKDTKATALDIEKSEKFYAPSPYDDTLISIAVYPYRNGSKVLYAFAYKYSVTPSGTTYNKNVIDDMKKSITLIAND